MGTYLIICKIFILYNHYTINETFFKVYLSTNVINTNKVTNFVVRLRPQDGGTVISCSLCPAWHV